MRYQLRHSPNATKRYTADERSPSGGFGLRPRVCVSVSGHGNAHTRRQPNALWRAGSFGLTVFPLTTIVGVPKPLLPPDSCCRAGSDEACW